MDGPEKGVSPLNPPPEPRVSTKRQGVIATKVRALATAFAEDWNCGPAFWGNAFAAASLSAKLACQYSGVAQFFSGTTFSCALCAVNSKGRTTRRDRARPEYFELII
jgi:hypothetical protein